jgi:hypothetical protein
MPKESILRKQHNLREPVAHHAPERTTASTAIQGSHRRAWLKGLAGVARDGANKIARFFRRLTAFGPTCPLCGYTAPNRDSTICRWCSNDIRRFR